MAYKNRSEKRLAISVKNILAGKMPKLKDPNLMKNAIVEAARTAKPEQMKNVVKFIETKANEARLDESILNEENGEITFNGKKFNSDVAQLLRNSDELPENMQQKLLSSMPKPELSIYSVALKSTI